MFTRPPPGWRAGGRRVAAFAPGAARPAC